MKDASTIDFVAIGHVDTGKSTLCGNLLYQCGYISEHDMNQITEKAIRDKMEKWKWARVLDIYQEEMERGKTHEFNEIIFDYSSKKYRLIDTPGHQSFIRSMISGIARKVNTAILVVSMLENEFEASFERGTLKEHLILVRATGIENLIIVGNKMDGIEWSEEKYNNIITKIKKFLTRIQWKKTNIHSLPISAFNGTNIKTVDKQINWYQGNSLLEIIVDITTNTCKKIDNNAELFKTKMFIADFVFLNSDDQKIITTGFECIMHYNGLESDVKIIKILDKNVTFMKVGVKKVNVYGVFLFLLI